MTGNVTVNAGTTLSIQPGTSVYFANGTKLTVNGTLNAVGNDPLGNLSTGHIRFTHDPATGSITTASWGGIYFANTTTANKLSYADIEFAGVGGPDTQIISSTADLDHVTWAVPGAGQTIFDVGNGATNLNSFSLTNSIIPTLVNAEPAHFHGQYFGWWAGAGAGEYFWDYDRA